jgi:hypothetical protein
LRTVSSPAQTLTQVFVHNGDPRKSLPAPNRQRLTVPSRSRWLPKRPMKFQPQRPVARRG